MKCAIALVALAGAAGTQVPWNPYEAARAAMVPRLAAVSRLNLAGCDPWPEDRVNAPVQDASSRQGVAADLVRAVIGKESGFRPPEISPKGRARTDAADAGHGPDAPCRRPIL